MGQSPRTGQGHRAEVPGEKSPWSGDDGTAILGKRQLRECSPPGSALPAGAIEWGQHRRQSSCTCRSRRLEGGPLLPIVCTHWPPASGDMEGDASSEKSWGCRLGLQAGNWNADFRANSYDASFLGKTEGSAVIAGGAVGFRFREVGGGTQARSSDCKSRTSSAMPWEG